MLFLCKQISKESALLFMSVLPDGSSFNQGYVRWEGSLSFEEPCGLSHSPRQTRVLENYPAQKNTEEKAFPTLFPRASQ